jgi:putative membrane protein
MGNPLPAVRRFLIGTLLGFISAVPGVSGVILAVTFGVYERLVEDIADIRHKVREDFRFLLVIGLGLLFGIIIVSFVLTEILDRYMIAAMLLFFGMIVGQLPQLWKYTMPEVKTSAKDIVALAIGIFIMCLLLVYNLGEIRYEETAHTIEWILLMIVIGVIYAVSHIAPGISGSTLLLAFGLLYLPLKVISEHDFILMAPLLLGTILGLIGFAKIVRYAIVNYRKPTYMMIFGFALGSTLVVLKKVIDADPGSNDLILGVVALAAGILISLWFTKIGKGISAENTVR